MAIMQRTFGFVGKCLNAGGSYHSVLALSLMLMLFTGATAQTIRYVKQGGTGDGSSWANASGDLQATINASQSGSIVYVAAGTYQRGTGQSFSMMQGVQIYGGFPVTGNPAFAERNWMANTTILQGNNATVVSNNNNGLTTSSILDGFTITNGAAGQGGGIYGSNVSPTLSNLVVTNNYASSEGGGMYFFGGSPVITGVSITQNTVGSSGNSVRRGGGLYSFDASPVLINVIVANNGIVGTGGLGGGLSFAKGSPSLLNVTVAGNTAATGSGVHTQEGALQVRNSIVWNNGFSITSGTAAWYNSIVQGSGGSAAWASIYGTNNEGNLDIDPVFIDAAGYDFRLSGTSPARHAGNTALFANAGTATDLDGLPRLYGAAIDMGAYEHQSDPPTGIQAQSFCDGITVAALLPAGSNIKWYNVATGGTALAANTVVTTGSYYISQTINGYESGRTVSAVTVNALPDAPLAAANQNFCGPATVAGLVAQGTDIKWYGQATGGTALSPVAALSAGTYYATQTTVCESLRTAVNVTFNVPSAPVANAMVFGPSATVANLSATGQDLKWYTAPAGGVALESTYPLATNTYYVSQTVNGCESERAAVIVTIFTTPIIYVKKNAAGNGTSWDSALGELAYALHTAKTINTSMPGSITQIWVSGGTYKPLLRADNLSAANPNDRDNAFVLLNDVKLYGGFAGTEASLAQRDLTVTANTTILSGDYSDNDTFDANGIPSMGTGENAIHVLYAVQNVGTAAVDGFIIRGGCADAPATLLVNGMSVSRGSGGGMAIISSAPSITNTIFEQNSSYTGGGMYLTNSVSVLTNVTFRDNYANNGGGMYCSGPSAPLVIQCSFTNNFAGISGGGLASTNVTIKSSEFQNNTAPTGGGLYSIGVANITNSFFFGNISLSPANGGGAIFGQVGTINCVNTTITKNHAVNGGGLDIKNGNAMLKNTIIWGNTASGGNTAGVRYLGSAPVFTNSLVQPAGNSGTSWPTAYGTDAGGNIAGIDPQFKDDAANNFTLLHSSPARNAGSTTLYPDASNETDLSGYPRVVGTSIDMGVYEHQSDPPAGIQPHTFCDSATVADLVASGSDIKWYDAATGGEELAADTQLSTGNYYVSQTINGYESARTITEVTINPLPGPPVTPEIQILCGEVTIANLAAEGTSIKWYSQESGGTVLGSSVPLLTGTYHASQTINGCESLRIAVEVTVNPIPPAPVAASQVFNAPTTVAALLAEGTDIKWYSSASGSTVLGSSAPLLTGTYYASQAINGCESPRTGVQVYVVLSETVFVKKNATGSGGSWDDAMSELANALKFAWQVNNITPGTITQIWVAAGTYKPMYNNYVTPSPYGTFKLPDNVELYGHFTGNETSVAQRALHDPSGQTILSGDHNDNDTYDADDRLAAQFEENANHIVTADVEGGATVLDGFTISNGQGAGVYVIYMSIAIKNCTAIHNRVSGIKMMSSTGSEITNVKAVSNISPQDGGGISCHRTDGIEITNVLVANNTTIFNGYAAGLVVSMSEDVQIVNTTVGINPNEFNIAFFTWGSSIVMANSFMTTFQINDPITLLNVMVPADTWQELPGIIKADPLFTDPANLDYTLQPGSPAINAGDTSLYPEAESRTDLAGNIRLFGSSIDIGAYESQSATSCGMLTIWNGTSWSNGTPVSYDYSAVIDGDYHSGDNGEITACSLTVNEGDVIVVTGDNFMIKGAVHVAGGSLMFENNANLVQVENVENTGEITYTRHSSALYNLDYTIWSSPTAGSQTLKGFSPETLDDRFYVYNTALNAYSNYNSASGIFGGTPDEVTFSTGKGYLIRMPDGWSSDTATPFEGLFTGTPNNGTIEVPVANSGNRYNAVGNPYPSPINVQDFITLNQSHLDNGTLYFWRKRNGSSGTTYATVTLAAYVAATAEGGDTSAGAFEDGDEAGWVINPGQGFHVKAAEGATAISFNNTMRRAVNNGQFFRMGNTAPPPPNGPMSKMWLNITSGAGDFGQAALVYSSVTTQGLDYGYDGRLFNDGVISIYTLAEETRLAIQARDAFNAADEVPLGYKVTTEGSYTISLDHFTGVFQQGQDIYLRDSQTGLTHNLTLGSYSFNTSEGTINNRFTVVYAPPLGVDSPHKNSSQILVWNKQDVIAISSGKATMAGVKIYDTRGRLLHNETGVNASLLEITGLIAEEQVLIVQITTAEGYTVSKKIIH